TTGQPSHSTSRPPSANVVTVTTGLGVHLVDLRTQTQALKQAIVAAIEAVLDRGYFVLGKDLEAFESEFAAYCDTAYAVGVDSGFSALELALRAGGMLVTNFAEIADAARILRHYGQRVKYEHEVTPLNHRLDTLQAAVLRIKLPHLDGWNDRRRKLADAYLERLADLPIGLRAAEDGRRDVHHLFV